MFDGRFRGGERKTCLSPIEEMQVALETYVVINTVGLHKGRGMNGRTCLKAFSERARSRRRWTNPTRKSTPTP